MSHIALAPHARVKFAAKVALSGGYFIYGDLFRHSIRHSELRAVMNLGPDPTQEDIKDFGLRVYDEFSSIDSQDEQEIDLQRFLCGCIRGSCLISVLGPKNLIFIVGVLGQHLATLNVPAKTDAFSGEGDFDLGHVITLCDGQMCRSSYRMFLGNVMDQLPQTRTETRRE